MIATKKMEKKLHFGDELEEQVAVILDKKGINYIHESENKSQILDFYLPDYDIFIEVKRFYTERVVRQLDSQENIIFIQGIKSINFLKKILCQE
jgi:hypothetical protein